MYSQGFYEVKWPIIEYEICSIEKLEYKALHIEIIKLQKSNIDKITLHPSCVLKKQSFYFIKTTLGYLIITYIL